MVYAGQTAFLTGGASGIAKAVTEMLVENGIKVYVADRDLKGAQAVAEQLNNGKSSQMVWAVEVDAADWDSQRKAFETAEAEFGRIDYVFPIAGLGERRSFPNRPDSKGYEKPDLTLLDVNCTGVIYTCWLGVQHFRRQPVNKYGFRGKITPVASVCGFYIHKPIPVYTAAKHAIVGFVRSYGSILIEENIALNTVCPNKVRTGISTTAVYDKAEKLGVLVPMKHVLEAFEMTLGDSKLAGQIIEVAPQIGPNIRPPAAWINEESRLSAEMTYARSHHLHEPVKD
ncbi:glucose 1-dehydrogenase [Rhizodiscina lignyota]|uniref:Glucose 1-dehydrogenase n=1 Tax=Rhizodiscina lignyota TaxID=1504668 RepID=A0A9P4I5W0_9PEZI|nr:glucose 1-dehydrogenase [Rhizodiscina lignyota]